VWKAKPVLSIRGELKYETQEIDFGEIVMPNTEAKLILADPERAFQLSFYPNNGVGPS
jgi:pyruvate, water dikinase